MDLDFKDERPLEDLPLAMNVAEADRPAAAERVRTMLRKCGVAVAEDIARVGCTGLASEGYSVSDIGWLRLNLAGSGIGLTCFVPPSLFCLGHNTIGGLQERQVPEHVEAMPLVSRELTADESKHRNTIEDARRVRGDKLDDRIAAVQKKLNETDVVDAGADGGGAVEEEEELDGQRFEVVGKPIFMCPEHRAAPDYGCRYCLAQALVAGDLSPRCLVTWDDGEEYEQIDAAEVPARIKKLDDGGADAAAVYVRVLRFQRKFTRV